VGPALPFSTQFRQNAACNSGSGGRGEGDMARLLTVPLAAATILFLSGVAEARKGGFLSGLAGGAARSAAKGGGGASAVKSYDENTLRPDALEACVRQARSMDERADGIDKRRAAVDAEEQRIAKRKAEIEQERAAAKNNAAIRRVNASIEAYNKELQAYRDLTKGFNDEVQAHNAVVADYRGKCSGKRYYQSDMDAVLLKVGVKIED
jgi:hypothetical protein